MIQNDIFLKALRGEPVSRPPVWMMRQAGRYLPEFQLLREKYDFFTRCRTPELAAEITLQPIRIIEPDAAILFSDILVVPQAMNVEVQMKEQVGPWLPEPVRSARDAARVIVPDIAETLGYVMEAIQLTKKMLNDAVPLIGFAGSPWTILCYMVEGKGSKNFDKAKKFCFSHPETAHELLHKITETTILYLEAQVKSGADVVQLFDSWGGLLSPADYAEFSWNYLSRIVEALAPKAPVIVFAKGCWFALPEMAKSSASALGIDWTCSPAQARTLTGGKVTLQGNFDPSRLYSPVPVLKSRVKEMIDAFGKDRYIVNLGHGILPDVPVEHARAFVDAVKEWEG